MIKIFTFYGAFLFLFQILCSRDNLLKIVKQKVYINIFRIIDIDLTDNEEMKVDRNISFYQDLNIKYNKELIWH